LKEDGKRGRGEADGRGKKKRKYSSCFGEEEEGEEEGRDGNHLPCFNNFRLVSRTYVAKSLAVFRLYLSSLCEELENMFACVHSLIRPLAYYIEPILELI
jgi:hypothetical protein